MEGADALDDDDARGSTVREPRALSGRPSRRTRKRAVAPGESGVDDLAREPVDVERRAVPELVGRDDLRPGNHAGERRLSRRAVAADADEDDAASRLRVAAAIRSSTGRASIAARYPHGHGEAAARRYGARERRPRPRPDRVGCRGPRRRRLDPLRLRPQAALRAERDDAVRQRPAAPGRGVRRAARTCGARCPRPGSRSSARGSRSPSWSASRPQRAARGARSSGFVAREAIAAFASLAPAAIALRGGELASYHGAEHISIGTYETGEPATKEHDRCGGHLVGPLLLTSAAASALAARAPASARPAARALGAIGAVGAAVEVFAWMGRHPDHPVSRALARPGHELAGARLDGGAVGGAARGRRGGARRLSRRRSSRVSPVGAAAPRAPRPRASSTSRSRRCGRATTPTRTSTTPARRCSPTAAIRAS